MQLVSMKCYAFDHENNVAYMFYRLNTELAEFILNNTKCPKDELTIGKSKVEDGYEFVYSISVDRDTFITEDDVDKYVDIVGNQICDIANSFDNISDFCDKVLLGGIPSSIHNLMSNTYNITDETLEWYTAHFFIRLGDLLYAPAFRWTSIEDDIENGEHVVAIQDGKITKITSVDEYNKLMGDNDVQ